MTILIFVLLPLSLKFIEKLRWVVQILSTIYLIVFFLQILNHDMIWGEWQIILDKFIVLPTLGL